MAFKIGNKVVLSDADPSATLLANSNLDKLQINGTDVLIHDGTTITLQNVDIKDASGVDLSDLSTSVNNNTTAINNNATAISNNATAINNNATAIANNATAIANNATAITNNETAINNNATAIANNATAITNTLVDAKAYTDTRETAITAVINSLTTDDIPESGTPTNIYFTDARVDTALGSVNADIIPASSETYNLGSATARWNKLFLKGTSIDLGGIDISASGTGMSVGGADMASETYADQAEADAVTTANAYTDTAIANLVDTAPTTLDTLNELAAALGDDANFSTTVTNSIATKLATADFTSTADTWLGTKDTGDLAEGSNLYYTDARADARATLRINAATTDNIDEGSTNLYYTDARVDARITSAGQTPVTGSDLDMNGNKVLFANVYPTTGDLPSATTYHGMFAHVHATGKGYFAHAGNWVELANQSDIPTVPTNNNQLTNGAGYVTTDTTYTAGNGLSLSGANEFSMSGSYTGSFTATGDVTAYSDKRLKRNIETITNAVDTVSKLRGVNYEKDGRNSTGVIAQEIEEVLPQVVHTDADGMKSVAYGNIVGILIEAIKEQQKEIEELKKKL